MTNSSHFSLRKAAFLVPALCLASVLTQSAQGQTITFEQTGLWSAGTSWVGGVPPTSTQTAAFTQAEAQTAQLDGDYTVRAVTVSSTAKTFQGQGGQRTVTVNSSTTQTSVSTQLTLDEATLSKTGTAAMNLSGGTISFLNGGTYSQTAGTMNISGTSAFNGNGFATFNRAAAGNVISLNIAGAVLNLGSGVTTSLTDGDVEAFASGTTINNSGTLNLNGSAGFTGSNGLTLNNSGTINSGTTDSILTAGSTIGLGGVYNLSIVDDSTGGSLSVTSGGSITISGSLNVSSSDVTDGSAFTILSAGTVTGQFAGLAEAAVFSAGAQDYRINYLGTSVTLTAVPEPQHYAGAIGLGLVAFAAFRRSRKSA